MSDDYEIEQETSEIIDSQSFNIKKGEIEYKFMIKSGEVKIVLTIIKQDQKNKLMLIYEKKLYLKDVKSLHPKFSKFTYCQELSKYIKNQIENNNLEIFEEYNELISIKLKQENIKIELLKIKPNLDLITNYFYEEICSLKANMIKVSNRISLEEINVANKELIDLKVENKILKEENEKIKNDIQLLKKENEKLKEDNNKYKQKKLEETVSKLIDNLKNCSDDKKYVTYLKVTSKLLEKQNKSIIDIMEENYKSTNLYNLIFDKIYTREENLLKRK